MGPTQPSYTMDIGSFTGVKQPGRGVDHPPLTSAEVKERVELYLYSPSWPVLWRTLPLPLPTRCQNLAIGRRCSATTVLCFPVITPFKEVAMTFNYANAVTKRGRFRNSFRSVRCEACRSCVVQLEVPARGPAPDCAVFWI